MVRRREQYIVDDPGKNMAVVLPVQRYRRLFEDLHDLAVVAERRDERIVTLDEPERRVASRGAAGGGRGSSR